MFKLAFAALAVLLLSGCTAAAMNGFQRGYMGYPPPQPYQLQIQPYQTPYSTTTFTNGTIYTPRGPVNYNSMTY